MSSRRPAFRKFGIALFLAVVASLVPMATAFADGGGTFFPH
jgi:hypothetical protein